MTKFLQIHTLTGYSGTLLNRDDTGMGKRLSYGGVVRSRVSSQCLKRHWRMFDGVGALLDIDGLEDGVRSKIVIENIAAEKVAEGHDEAVVGKVRDIFLKAAYGEKALETGKRQPLLFGQPEIRFISEKMSEVLAAEDPKVAAEAFAKDYKAIMKQMREQTHVAAGLAASLFGRMVTSDPAANIEAPVHVAHAVGVHADRSELDFFSVVDDLIPADETGAGHIGESEIGSTLYYGYVVIDVDGLVANLSGDRDLAGEVVSRLVRIIATASPGAKKGSTAPYAYAQTVLVEAGDAQPRSLVEAFRKPVAAEHAAAEEAMAAHLRKFNENYATGEDRAYLSQRNEAAFDGAERADITGVAAFAKAKVAA